MLNSGHPPDDWQTLLAQAKKEEKRFKKTLGKLPP